jgi:BON domain
VRKYLFALVVAAALAGLGQAASVAPSGPGVSKSTAVKAPASQQVLADAQIERNIRARLAKSKMSGTEHFTVSMQNGVATLSGKTNVIQHKGVATRLAKSGGAVAVRNQIQISDEARAKAAAKLAKYRTAQAEPVRATVLQASKGK